MPRDLEGVATVILPQCSPSVDPNKNKDSYIALALQTQALTGYWEKTDSPRYTYSRNAYKPGWGHLSEEVRLGEVAFPGPHTIGSPFGPDGFDASVGKDEVIERTTYIDDTEKWLVGLEMTTEILDSDGKRFSASRTYYDGDEFQPLDLGKADRGKVTRQEAWLYYEEDGSERWIPVSRQALNAHGQVSATLDANDNRRELRYDDETGTFVAEERIEVELGWLVYKAWYDRARGQVKGATDFNGHTTRFLYDGLGRLEKIVDPLGSEAQPLTRYTYTYGTSERPSSVTKVEQLVDAQTAELLESWTYSDGLGRVRLAKVKAEASLCFVGSGWGKFSARGQRVLESAAFASSTSELEKPPTETPASVMSFDLLDRIVRTRPPRLGDADTYQLTQYLPLETRVYDERDTSEGTMRYPAVTRFDGLGRIVEQRKYNDYDEVWTELAWKAGFNPLGKITSLTDPGKHVRNYKYDSLGRPRYLNDPNAGTIKLDYDDVGNRAERVDALGQRIVWEYEKGNRLRIRRLHTPDGTEQAKYVFHYDAPGAGLPDARNLLGGLSWVEQTVGNVYWSYDEMGRTKVTVQELRSPDSAKDGSVKSYRLEIDYDRQGNVKEEHFPGNVTVKRRYSPRALLQEITASLNDQILYGATLRHDPNGQPVRADYANGLTTCWWYDRRQCLHGLRTSRTLYGECGEPEAPANGVFQHLVYETRPEGVIDSIRDLAPRGSNVLRLDASFQYDRLYELVEASSPGERITYKYDTVQNLTRRSVSPPSSTLPTGDLRYGENGAGPNSVTTAFDESYQYNAAGELEAHNGFRLDFDVEGRLASVRMNDELGIRWLYDYSGARRLKITTQSGLSDQLSQYPFDGYSERDGIPTWCVRAGDTTLGEIAATLPPSLEPDVRYYHSDHRGSPIHTSDRLGELLSSIRWHPYGLLAAQAGPKPITTFAGAQWDEEPGFWLIEMGARWYAPKCGRWITPDPLFLKRPELGIREPLQMNLYSYALNDPAGLVDSTGLGFWGRVADRTAEGFEASMGIARQQQTIAGERLSHYDLVGYLTAELNSLVWGGVGLVSTVTSIPSDVGLELDPTGALNFTAAMATVDLWKAGPALRTFLSGQWWRVAGSGGTAKNALNLSTVGRTSKEAEAIREYARRTNQWLKQEGRQTIQATKGPLRREASAAARRERLRAARASQPYQGQAGHVPDTAISGKAEPPGGWLDMPGKSNSAAGGALGSRVGKPVDVILVDGEIP